MTAKMSSVIHFLITSSSPYHLFMLHPCSTATQLEANYMVIIFKKKQIGTEVHPCCLKKLCVCPTQLNIPIVQQFCPLLTVSCHGNATTGKDICLFPDLWHMTLLLPYLQYLNNTDAGKTSLKCTWGEMYFCRPSMEDWVTFVATPSDHFRNCSLWQTTGSKAFSSTFPFKCYNYLLIILSCIKYFIAFAHHRPKVVSVWTQHNPVI